MWSVGCILAEMLSSKPLFPGRDYHHQLTLILDVLGTPTFDEFYAITTRRSRDLIRALPFRKRHPFAQLFPNANPLAVDFLAKTLVSTLLLYVYTCADPRIQTFDPKKRMTVEDALAHPYLEAYARLFRLLAFSSLADIHIGSTIRMTSPSRPRSTPSSSNSTVSSPS